MKPVLLTVSIAAIIAVAACSGREEPTTTDTPASNASTPTGPVTVENAYDIRHDRFEGMGDSIKGINRELKAGAPDVARIRQDATVLASAAEQLPSWFPAGSGADVHTRSRAKSEIWTDPQGFSRAHQGFQEQARSFQQLAEAGDVEALRGAVGALGKSCGNCHDTYRAPEK